MLSFEAADCDASIAVGSDCTEVHDLYSAEVIRESAVLAGSTDVWDLPPASGTCHYDSSSSPTRTLRYLLKIRSGFP